MTDGARSVIFEVRTLFQPCHQDRGVFFVDHPRFAAGRIDFDRLQHRISSLSPIRFGDSDQSHLKILHLGSSVYESINDAMNDTLNFRRVIDSQLIAVGVQHAERFVEPHSDSGLF